jgi:hypothetical protein
LTPLQQPSQQNSRQLRHPTTPSPLERAIEGSPSRKTGDALFRSLALIKKALFAVFKIARSPTQPRVTLFVMAEEIHIVKVEKDGEDGLIVTFSDGTTGGYVVEELLSLRPIREPLDMLLNTHF